VTADTAVAPAPFGLRLRQWRQHRGLSQLALAVKVGSTSRHISFLETGRSRPSRQMVLRLSDVLEVGLRDRNHLLHAAGFAAAYPRTGLDGGSLRPYREAMARLLRAHEPYPAMVVDKHWTVVSANEACPPLYGADLVGSNIVRRYLTDPAGRAAIVNWTDIAWSAWERLRHQQADAPFDDDLRELATAVERVLAGISRPEPAPSQYLVCPWFRVGDETIRTISMVARFEPVTEITLDELRIELTYPQDAVADRFFRTHARPRPSTED
jgi:transcriptional regulator with XRE-family HTH domain